MNASNCVNSTADIVYIYRTEKQPMLDPRIERLANDAVKIYNSNPKDCKFLI